MQVGQPCSATLVCVQSIERAMVLLRDASSLDGAVAILREVGFAPPALSLDAIARAALGLPPGVQAAQITQGADSLRGLVLQLSDAAAVRDSITAVANALSRRAPQLLWMLVGFNRASREIGMACWSTTHSRTRIVSLLCHQDRLFESDAETLCALAAAAGDSDLTTHARWLDVLGREAITRRFFRALQGIVGELADSLGNGISRAERHELALL